MILKVFKAADKAQYKTEQCILNKLRDQEGFPQIISTMENEQQMEILMPKYGGNLTEALENLSAPNPVILIKIFIQLTKRLKTLHSIGYIHNDLKPENVVISPDLETAYLIDFGISETYLNEDGTRKPQIFKGFFSGNKFFCSINACTGKTKYPIDDV